MWKETDNNNNNSDVISNGSNGSNGSKNDSALPLKKNENDVNDVSNNDSKEALHFEKNNEITNVFSNFNYQIYQRKEGKRLGYCNNTNKEKNQNPEFSLFDIRPLPEKLFSERKENIPFDSNNFKRQFINGLPKEKLIIFCTLIIIIIIIALRYLAFFYYENELEIMKNRIDREKNFYLFKEIEKDPFFNINKKRVFLAGSISLLMTGIILYLTVKKRD